MDEFRETTKQAGHKPELIRLSDNHAVLKDAMGGQLLLAPGDLSKPGLRVFDSAGADGTWLRDLQSSTSNPDATYIGTDIEPELFPPQLPPSMTLVAHDFTKPWRRDWLSSFDVVHQRLGLAGSGPTPQADVVANLAGLVKPGGWLELVELDIGEESRTNDARSGPALREFIQLLREIFTLIGLGGNFAPKMCGWLEAAGLQAVEERLVDCPVGARSPTAELAARSINGVTGAIEPLVAMAKTLPTSFTPSQLSSLAERLSAELSTQGGSTRFIIAYGRKPLSVSNGKS